MIKKTFAALAILAAFALVFPDATLGRDGGGGGHGGGGHGGGGRAR